MTHVNNCCLVLDAGEWDELPLSMKAGCMMAVERTKDPHVYDVKKDKYFGTFKGAIMLDVLNLALIRNKISIINLQEKEVDLC